MNIIIEQGERKKPPIKPFPDIKETIEMVIILERHMAL